MRWLLFLSRVAFLAGIVMVFALAYLYLPFTLTEVVSSNFITAGFGLALVVLPFTCAVYLALFVTKKKLRSIVPSWLIICNVIFLLLLVIFYL